MKFGNDNYEYKESGNFYTRATIAKYDSKDVEWIRTKTGLVKPRSSDFRHFGIDPLEISDGGQPGNLLVNVGIQQLEDRLITGEQVWDSTHTGIGVGNSTTAASASDTDLIGGSTRYNQVDSSPNRSGQTLTFVATFDTTEGNFAWQEWGIIVPNTTSTFTEGATKPANYVLLNRKVTSLGTKTSAQSWVFTVTMSIA